MEKTQFQLSTASDVADRIVDRLAPYCRKIEVAGSIRRHRPWVHDIDVVLIPGDAWNLYHEIIGLSRPMKPKPDGPKIKGFKYAGIPVDLYIADERDFITLLLIRTGSAKNNVRLCLRAQELGFQLHADGSGLFNREGKRIAGDTELSIYNALGLKFQEPRERN